MKLLIDCTPLYAGGGVQVALALLEGLSRFTDVRWMAVLPQHMEPILSDSIRSGGCRIEYCRKGSRLDVMRIALKLHRIERSFAPDIAFTVFGPAYFKARAAHVVGFALPNLIYEPNDRVGPLIRANGPFSRVADVVRRQLLRRADHIVVETETVRERLAHRIKFDPERISVIRNCVNPRLLMHPSDLDLPRGCFGIIVPSAYYPHKNLEILPSVAAALQQLKQDLDFEIRLTISADSRQWTAIAGAARKLGVQAHVKTLGYLSLDALAAAYGEASAVLLPTLREASTAVYPESFHFKRPLVTSDMKFARELCGDAALYAAPLDPNAFAEQLCALACKPDLVRHQVANGKRRLAINYPTAERKLQQQIELFRLICRRQSRCTHQISTVSPASE